MNKLCTAILVATFAFCAVQPGHSTGVNKSISIAPDLSVESFQGGKFPEGHGPDDNPKKIIFVPTNISKCCGYTYGYKIALKTTRKKIKMSVQFDHFEDRPEQTFVEPVNGLIYRNWDDGALNKHEYDVKVRIENVDLPLLHFVRK